jgi:hypothetical protein
VAALSKQELASLGLADEAILKAMLGKRPAELYVDREIKGLKKRVDVGAALVDICVGQGVEALRRAGFEGDLLPIAITLRLGGKTTPRPGEALEALTGIDSLAPRVVRAGFFATRSEGRVAPLQLEALRSKPNLQAAE